MSLRDVLKILKPYRTMMAIIMVYAILISVIAAVVPFVNSHMIDKGLLAGSIPTVILFVLILILLQVSDRIIQYFQTKKEIRITNAIGKKMKVEAFEHGLRLKPKYFKEESFYKTIGDALYDIGSIMNITNNNFLIIFVIICKSIGAAIGLVILDWRLAICVMVLIPIKLWINTNMRNQGEKLGEELMHVNKSYNAWFSDILSGIIDIKLWNLNKKKTLEYEEHVEQINESSKNLSMLTAKNTLVMQAMELITMNSIYILGAFLIGGNQLTFGNLVAFISFSSYLLVPVNIIMDLRVILKQIKPSVAGIKKFNELEEENYAASLPLANKISKIEFRHVSVTLGGRDILKDISFNMSCGEKIAFVGDNGSGKTTIINLLTRIYEPTTGEILIDGIPIKDYNIEDYREKFSIVTQDIHLFKGTVKENITFDNTMPAFEDDCAKFCTDTIEKWDKHYETEVGNEGTKLSGGERQKIALLRALNHKSQILILDEATASYDKESDHKFNEFIEKNEDYDFYLVVTHRKEILSCVDKILHLSHGRLITTDT